MGVPPRWCDQPKLPEPGARIQRQGPAAVGLRSFSLGLIFAAGLTPCIGPVLGAIIGLASFDGESARGTLLLVAYSLGLGVPFIAAAMAVDAVTAAEAGAPASHRRADRERRAGRRHRRADADEHAGADAAVLRLGRKPTWLGAVR